MPRTEVAARFDNRVYSADQQNGLRGVLAKVGQNRLILAVWIGYWGCKKSSLRALRCVSSSEACGRFTYEHHAISPPMLLVAQTLATPRFSPWAVETDDPEDGLTGDWGRSVPDTL